VFLLEEGDDDDEEEEEEEVQLKKEKVHFVPRVLPLATGTMSPHPGNCSKWLGDREACIIRKMDVEGGVSKSKLPVVLSLAHLLNFKEVPTSDDIPSPQTIDIAYQRLAFRDRQLLNQELMKNIALDPHARIYSCTDDTKYRGVNRHIHFVSYYDAALQSPMFVLLSLKGTPSKDSIANANENLLNLIKHSLPLANHAGFASDHAALAEGTELGKLIQDNLKALKVGMTDQEARYWVNIDVRLGDEAHKYALPWKHMSITIWGKDSAVIQAHHIARLVSSFRFSFKTII
jgi:hypothetical protein